MARAVKRKKTTGNAAGMAAMRDAGTVRELNFNKINKIMNDIGPGSQSDKDIIVYRIHMGGSHLNILMEYMGSFLSVMYLDMIRPGYFTPGKLNQWKDIAHDIAIANKEKEVIKKIFNRVSRQMGSCSKKMVDLIHFEATEEELKYTLYDVVLKISMEYNIDLKGMLPSI